MEARVSALWKKYDSFEINISDLSELKVKVDTMWIYQIRRGLGEVVMHGMGKMESPLVINEESMKILEPLKPQLMELYQKKKLDDLDMLLEIEKYFGEEIVRSVCVPYKMSHGACLILALGVAKDTTVMDINTKCQVE